VLKKVLFGVSVVALGAAVLIPCQAAAPLKVATVAPVADLVAEAELKIKALDEALASDKSYLESKTTSLPADAGVLAVLAQAIVESEEKAAWKASAPDLRDGAVAVASAKSYDEAKAGLAAVKSAFEGKAGAAKPEAEWNKLCRLKPLMKEVNKRNTKLRRASKNIPPNSDEAARDASVLAVLGLAAHDDTHEVKNPAEVPEWQTLSKDFSTQMTAMATALKAKDKAAAGDAFGKANKACNGCHDKWRKD
jgi:cytochrome c556